jgi:hypothetical protein
MKKVRASIEGGYDYELDSLMDDLAYNYEKLPEEIKVLFINNGVVKLKFSKSQSLDYIHEIYPDLITKYFNAHGVKSGVRHNLLDFLNDAAKTDNTSTILSRRKSKGDEDMDQSFIENQIQSLFKMNIDHPSVQTFNDYYFNNKMLTKKDIENFENHLESCDRCQKAVKSLRLNK